MDYAQKQREAFLKIQKFMSEGISEEIIIFKIKSMYGFSANNTRSNIQIINDILPKTPQEQESDVKKDHGKPADSKK